MWFNRQFLLDKLNNPLGLLILVCIGFFVSVLVSTLGLKLSIVLYAALIGIPLLLVCIFNLQIGVGLILTISFFIEFLGKHANAPFGIMLDLLIFAMLFGLLVLQIKDRDFSFAKNQMSFMILLWVFYCLIQVLNPWAGSKMAWVFTVRSMALQSLIFFIACYAFNSKERIYAMLKLLIFLGVFAGAYGVKQEIYGYTNAEMAWVMQDPERFQLIFQWSRLRVVSLFAGPTNYGILMVYISAFCAIMATAPLKKWKRVVLALCVVPMMLGAAYAGSRTPFVLIPFGLLVYVMMTLKREVIIGATVFLLFGSVVVMKSTGNAVLYRIQSSFSYSKSDDTMDLRFKNQKFIQPFIYRHPFGAGLGSTGIWGQRFTPGTMLASFAHDSGFVRVAVEAGWIGLIIYCFYLFTVFQLSIRYYTRSRDPVIKVVYLGLNVIFFQLLLANYPQESIVQLPTMITFHILLAVMVRLKDFDEPDLSQYILEENGEESSSESINVANDEPLVQPR